MCAVTNVVKLKVKMRRGHVLVSEGHLRFSCAIIVRVIISVHSLVQKRSLSIV